MPKFKKFRETASVSEVAEKLQALFRSSTLFIKNKIIDIDPGEHGAGYVVFEIKRPTGIELSKADTDFLDKKSNYLDTYWYIRPVDKNTIHVAFYQYS